MSVPEEIRQALAMVGEVTAVQVIVASGETVTYRTYVPGPAVLQLILRLLRDPVAEQIMSLDTVGSVNEAVESFGIATLEPGAP